MNTFAKQRISEVQSHFTYRGWHTVKESYQHVKAGDICIHWQTAHMSAPAFWYFDSWDDVPNYMGDLRDTPEAS
jgi:hypothetical protein